MGLQQLTLDSLADLDMGKASEMFQVMLRRAAEDCIDRPGDTSNRTVSLKFQMVPITDQRGECSEVALEVLCEGKFPAYRTKSYSMGVRRDVKGAMVVFNADSPDNINQRTFEMGEEA